MAMSYKARRRWSLVLLLVWLPLYVVLAVSLYAAISPMNKVLEFIYFVVAGVAWALPFKSVFKGIGKPDPDADE
jgi:hypothetical protein